jgi:hypothetical protein
MPRWWMRLGQKVSELILSVYMCNDDFLIFDEVTYLMINNVEMFELRVSQGILSCSYSWGVILKYEYGWHEGKTKFILQVSEP